MPRFLLAALIGCACTLWTSSGSAQDFPSRPIRFVIGFPPGTVLDAIARVIAPDMEKRLGQPIVLEFKPGASATIAAKYVVNASPDGYTLFYGNALISHPLFNRNNAVDAGKDLAPVSSFAMTPFFLVSRASLPVASFQELVAYSRANPDGLKHASQAPTIDLIMKMLKERAGITSRSIPYKASPQTVIALLAGEVDLSSAAVQAFLSHIQSGRVRALFVASAKRSSLLPDVPTAAEAGLPNFEMANTYGIWAPVGTPRDAISKLSGAAAEVLRIPAVAEQIRKGSGAEALGSTPEEHLRTFQSEARFWAEAARLANFQPQ